jgi:hypothetical protein
MRAPIDETHGVPDGMSGARHSSRSNVAQPSGGEVFGANGRIATARGAGSAARGASMTIGGGATIGGTAVVQPTSGALVTDASSRRTEQPSSMHVPRFGANDAALHDDARMRPTTLAAPATSTAAPAPAALATPVAPATRAASSRRDGPGRTGWKLITPVRAVKGR